MSEKNTLFIAYHFIKDKRGKASGFGNGSVKVSASLPLSLDDIREIEDYIRQKGKLSSVVLLNYMRLADLEGSLEERR